MKCKTCDDEGITWLLTPCPDCKKGKQVNEIGERITKNLKTKEILHKADENVNLAIYRGLAEVCRDLSKITKDKKFKQDFKNKQKVFEKFAKKEVFLGGQNENRI